MFFEKARQGLNQWYLYIFTLVAIFLSIQIAYIPLIAYSAWSDGYSFQNQSPSSIVLKTNTNLGLTLVLFTFIIGLTILLFCVKYIHKKRIMDILTSRQHFDLKRCLFGMLIWGILSLLIFGLQFLAQDSSHLIFQFEAKEFLIMCLIVFTLLPFQVAFEEFIFRGYLMQGLNLLFRRRWIAFLCTSTLFALLHGSNPEVRQLGFWVTMPQYFLMGLLLGLVTIIDDGVELAVGIHLSNNLLTSILITHDASTLQTHALFRDLAPTASPWDSVIILISGIIFITICHFKYQFSFQQVIDKKI